MCKFSVVENRPLLQELGANVRRHRKARGLSLAEVSARMTDLGVPLALNSLSKVELGNRGLELDELVAVARALDVSPLLLVFPVGHSPSVELLPGAPVSTWTAAQWFTGEAPLPAGAPGSEWADAQRWADSPAALFRDHDELVRRWIRANSSMARATSTDERELTEELRASVLDQLRRHRALMRRDGVEPLELPAPLRNADHGPEEEVGG